MSDPKIGEGKVMVLGHVHSLQDQTVAHLVMTFQKLVTFATDQHWQDLEAAGVEVWVAPATELSN